MSTCKQYKNSSGGYSAPQVSLVLAERLLSGAQLSWPFFRGVETWLHDEKEVMSVKLFNSGSHPSSCEMG